MGMIEQAQPKEQAAQYKSGAAAVVPPEHQDAFARVVLAGLKVFYSPQMKETIQETISAEGEIETNLAKGMTGLMALLDQKSKPSLPLPVIFPAAVELLYEITEFLAEVGAMEPLTKEQMATTVQLTVGMIAKRYKMPDEMIMQMLTGKVQGEPTAAPQPGVQQAQPAEGV